VEVRLRRGPSGEVLGYAVAQRWDLLAPGSPIFYSGSKLAPDLSLPRLRARWGQVPSAPARRAGKRLLQQARDAVASGREQPEAIAAGVADVVTALASAALPGAREGWWKASDLAHRAVPTGTAAKGSLLGSQLRGLARGLLRSRGFASRDEVGATASTVALAQLLVELAAVQQRRSAHRAEATPQARAASAAAVLLEHLPPPLAGRARDVQRGGARARDRSV